MNLRSLIAPTLLTLALCACGAGEDYRLEAEGPFFHHLELTASPPRTDSPSIERALRWLPSPADRFHVTLGTGERLPLEAPLDSPDTPATVLVLNGETGFNLNLAIELNGYEFNTVAMEIEYRHKRDLTLDFVSDNQRLLGMRGKALTKKIFEEGQSPRQVVHFQLPTLYRQTEQIQRIILHCHQRIEDFRILSIDFLHTPLSLHLPSPETGANLILANEEQRRGIGLGTQYGLRGEALVEENSTLRFSYAAPANSAESETDSAIELTISSPLKEPQIHRFVPQDPSAEKGEYRWFDIRVPLTDFAGEQVAFEWTVQSPRNTPWALAEAGVVSGTGLPRRVLLITSDTHRADHLGAAHSDIHVATPHLDALSERGVLFEDCFVATNITNPSHIAMMTATHPRDTGVFSNNEPISSLAPTLAEAFHGAGFTTLASISIKHLSDETSGLGQGFDRLSYPRVEGKRDGTESIADMLTWVDENEDLPLFLWVHIYDAHTPYAPPAQMIADYYHKDPASAFDPSAPKITGVPDRVYKNIFPGLKDLEYPKALYVGEVANVDVRLDQLLNHPRLSNAVIAFTSDHGESLGQHGVYYAHADLYPDSLHVPLLITYPGSAQGQRVSGAVQQLDLGRTLLDLSGAWAAEFPGVNLLAQAHGDGEELPPRFGIGAGRAMASVTYQDWHLILALKEVLGHHRAEMRTMHEVNLFHLGRDPHTEHDLLDSEREKAQELRELLITWLSQAEDRGWRGAQVTDTETLRSLEALGYAAVEASAPEIAPVFFDRSCVCDWCQRF